MIHHPAFQTLMLFAAITGAFLGHHYIPLKGCQMFYAFSLFLKECLMFLLPAIIFTSVYTSFSKLKQGALYVAGILLGWVVVWNFCTAGFAGLLSSWIISTETAALSAQPISAALSPLWAMHLPKLNSLIALIAGVGFALFNHPASRRVGDTIAKFCQIVSDIFLKKVFIPLLPVFVFGFMLKLLKDKTLNIFLANIQSFTLILAFLTAFTVLLFAGVVVFYKKNPKFLLQNLSTPMLVGLTTMSSAAALPFSLEAAKKNTGDKAVSDLFIPSTFNFHMLADNIVIPMCAIVMMVSFGQPFPSLTQYLIFLVFYTISKFYSAGVPGGSIMVVNPILETYFGFSPDMIAMITLCYIILDPLITCFNVVGNNLSCIYFDRFYKRIMPAQ